MYVTCDTDQTIWGLVSMCRWTAWWWWCHPIWGPTTTRVCAWTCITILGWLTIPPAVAAVRSRWLIVCVVKWSICCSIKRWSPIIAWRNVGPWAAFCNSYNHNKFTFPNSNQFCVQRENGPWAAFCSGYNHNTFTFYIQTVMCRENLVFGNSKEQSDGSDNVLKLLKFYAMIFSMSWFINYLFSLKL